MGIRTSVLKGFYSKVTCHFHSHFIDQRKSYSHGEVREGECHCGHGKKRREILVKKTSAATIREDVGLTCKLLYRRVTRPSELPGCPSFTYVHYCPFHTEWSTPCWFPKSYSSCPSMVHRLDAQAACVR